MLVLRRLEGQILQLAWSDRRRRGCLCSAEFRLGLVSLVAKLVRLDPSRDRPRLAAEVPHPGWRPEALRVRLQRFQPPTNAWNPVRQMAPPVAAGNHLHRLPGTWRRLAVQGCSWHSGEAKLLRVLVATSTAWEANLMIEVLLLIDAS